jgi:hypothetical protein
MRDLLHEYGTPFANRLARTVGAAKIPSVVPGQAGDCIIEESNNPRNAKQVLSRPKHFLAAQVLFPNFLPRHDLRRAAKPKKGTD